MVVGYSGGWVSWGRVSKGVEYPGGRVYSQKGHGTKDTLLPRRNIVPEIPYPVKEHGTKDTLLPRKDMGPGQGRDLAPEIPYHSPVNRVTDRYL